MTSARVLLRSVLVLLAMASAACDVDADTDDKAAEEADGAAVADAEADADADADAESTSPGVFADLRALVGDSAPAGFARIPDGEPGSGFAGPADGAALSRSDPELFARTGFARAYLASWESGQEVFGRIVYEFNSELGAQAYLRDFAERPLAAGATRTQVAPGGSLEVVDDADVKGARRIALVFPRQRWVFMTRVAGVPKDKEATRTSEIESLGQDPLAATLPSGPLESPAAQACREMVGLGEHDTDAGIGDALERGTTLASSSPESGKELGAALQRALEAFDGSDIKDFETAISDAHEACAALGMSEELTARTMANSRRSGGG
jgi:hypothetical protein